MRVVLYAEDMEPITVLELSAWVVQHLERHRTVRIPVLLPPMTLAGDGTLPTHPQSFPVVDIFAERLAHHGRNSLILFTRSEENALLLKCAFLPGQEAGLQEREREHFAKGFLSALNLACGG